MSDQGPVTPMLVLGGISYANNWYNTGNAADVKPLLFAAVGAVLLDGFSQIPGMAPVATLLGWTAVVGMLISPVQSPSPAQNLIKLTSDTASAANKKITKKGK